MTPTPQQHDAEQNIPSSADLDEHRVVISGMSGMFPKSHSVKDLSNILYNKIDPVAPSSRFDYHHPEVVNHTGNVPGLSFFDAQFFKVHYRLGHCMDPMGRKILEHSYQAIYDAGINPDQLSGKKVGVYIGSCFSEAEKASFYEANSRTGFGIAGCSKTMFANRISYWLNAKGPSMSIDGACCSSTAAIEQAYLAIARGECEAAIVGGAYLCLHPQSFVHYGRMIKLCGDGKTKSFDERADGCVKSEAINVLFLQKASCALRAYADVVYVKTNFTSLLPTETGPKFGFSRNSVHVANFLKKFYEEAKVSPQAVEYVEGFGSAVLDDDKVELEAIEEVFCKDRDDTLYIGSITSNIGYSEAATGISATVKVLLGYHYGELAANLHCEQPRNDIVALREGRMRILTEHQRFNSTYVAINGNSVTGASSHVLLHGHHKPKDLSRYKTSIPYLVTVSGRHEEAVKHVLEALKSNPIDAEQLALLNNIHKTSVAGHMGRGFIIMKTNEEQNTVSLFEKVDYFDDMNRPLWFVYSGMGSQWAGMGTALLRIPIFAAAIERCRVALEPKGLDIVDIITSLDESIFNNILHSFVGIAAIQIGLTDILHAIGLKPQGIIGHSVGELGCAYADGCLTAEEMILSAYYRGLVSLETEFIHGSMAAVGMGYEQISKICPPEIEVACHNGPESSTISGPADVMRAFVADLSKRQIFAREVPCSNIAYHSRYIADAGPGLLKYLRKAIIDPKPRSGRWLSSSVPQHRWDEPIAKLCSAEYLTNNLLNPVLFEETSKLIPNNAVLVEVAPHGLLQAILKRSMPSNCLNIPLTRRKHPDNTFLLLQAIGMLYMEGYNSNLEALYPKVEFPVSTGTPLLSHFVKWAHGENWPLAVYRTADRKTATNWNYGVALHDKEHSYVQGNSIRGKILFPFAASLILAWDTLAMMMNVPKKQLSVEFTDIQLHTQPILHDKRQLDLQVAINAGIGWFEILDGISKVVSGFIKPSESHNDIERMGDFVRCLNSEDIYQLLRERDYYYSGEFQAIECVDEDFSEADIAWRDNWVTFIDSMLQLNVLRQPCEAFSVPVRIRRLKIDVKNHSEIICNSVLSDNKLLLRAKILEEHDNTRCGGVLIDNIIFKNLPLLNNTFSLKTLEFVSHFGPGMKVSSSLEVYLQMIAENINKDAIDVVGVRSNIKEGFIFKEINNVIKNIFDLKINYKEITEDMDLINSDFDNVDLILVQDLSINDKVRQKLERALQREQFIVSEENSKKSGTSPQSSFYRVVSVHCFDQYELRLIRWKSSRSFTATTTISVRSEEDFKFLCSVYASLASHHRLLIITPYPTPHSLKQLILSWRKEAKRNKIHVISVDNDNIGNFEEKLSDVELTFNVLNNGEWGGEYYITVEENLKRTNVTLECTKFDDNESLLWVETPALPSLSLNVTIHYAGISIDDIRKANGLFLYRQNIDGKYGQEFSGITESGERVMGILCSGAISTQLRAQPELLWPVPAHWSLEEAATVPLAYMQAFYCVGIKSYVCRGGSILVHDGTSPLGQAIISISLAHDCEVFTTVTDIHKKDILLKLFPALKADHIGSSCDESFGYMVRTLTKHGCNVIISHPNANFKDVDMHCLSIQGIYCDISQVENHDDYRFGMSHLNLERNYVCVDLSSIFDVENNMADIKLMNKMLSDGIAHGYVRPISHVTFTPQEVSRAFLLAASKQRSSQVLLHMKNNALQVHDRLICDVKKYHLIFCGNLKFGLLLADKLVCRGIKKLCILVQRKSPYLQHKIRIWREQGVEVLTFYEKLKDLEVCYGFLNNILRLGNLEGVYITTHKNFVDTQDVINNLDFASRALCPELRYFAVFNIGNNSDGRDLCMSRICDRLPATMLTIPELSNEINIGHDIWRGAVDAAERALRSNHSVLFAHGKREPQPTILQRISTLAGIIIPDDANQSVTLKELGLNSMRSEKLKHICSVLRLHYNIAFDTDQLPSLTLETIMQLDKTIIDLPYEDKKGLETFFSYVDSDELLATTEMVLLPTLVSSASMRGDEFEPNQKNLYIVPGMEGHHERFRKLCTRLKLPAIVLQPGLDNQQETISETAQRFAEILLKKNEIKDTFYLLGYESGIYIALEIAAILEENGLTGTVYCLGCAPSELKKELEENLAEFETEDQLFNAVVKHMVTLMVGGNMEIDMDLVLRDISSRAEKIDIGVRTLLGKVSHSAQYAQSLIEAPLIRIEQVRQYNITPRLLRSQLVLLRAKTKDTTSQHTSLQQYSMKPVAVYELPTTLAHCNKDLRCASIINEYLGEDILNDFKTRNLCDTYLLNAETFMCVVYDAE